MADIKQLRYGKPYPLVTSGTITNRVQDATTDQIEYIFQVPEDLTCTQLGVRLGNITGTTPTYKISLQGVDASGNPNGTILGGGSPASKTFSPSSLGWSAGTWNWLTLDNSIALTRGSFYAIVIAYDSGTVDASNNASFTAVNSGTQRFPYAINNNAGTRSRESGFPCFGYASSTKAFGRPMVAQSFLTIQNGTTPDEVAMKFTLPAGAGDTYKLVGARVVVAVAAGSTLKIILYGGTDATPANSTGAVTEATVFQDVTFDGDLTNSTTNGDKEFYFDETTLTTLYYGATYRLAIQPTAAVNVVPVYHDVASASDWDAFPGGQDFAYSSRVDAGNWTDLTTRRLFVDLIFEDMTEPASSGTGIVIKKRKKVFTPPLRRSIQRPRVNAGTVNITNNTTVSRRKRVLTYQTDIIQKQRIVVQGGSMTVNTFVPARVKRVTTNNILIRKRRHGLFGQAGSITNNTFIPARRKKVCVLPPAHVKKVHCLDSSVTNNITTTVNIKRRRVVR